MRPSAASPKAASPAASRRTAPSGQALAVAGGDPIVPGGKIMRSKWPRFDSSEISAVLELLKRGLLTEMSGQAEVHTFEQDFGLWIGTEHVLTTGSGTASLHCALAGLGLESGDEVIVPALTYIACGAAVLHHQGIPVFADVDPVTHNLTAATVRPRISGRTRAIMAVHLHGLPAPMDELLALSAETGIPLLEDFSQAVGARYRGRYVGSLGAVGAASLMAGKNLPSAGEAGVVTTGDREVRNRAAHLKCFGESRHANGTYEVQHSTFGWNYRANLLSLAVAGRQLFHVDELNERRRRQAARLDAALAELPGFEPPAAPAESEHVYHMYRFRFDPAAAGLDLSIDQMREGLKQVFWAEGLPLVEFQNSPLPGHALFREKVGYGRGCPWSCHGREDLRYEIEDYPGALAGIRGSLVVGYPAQAPLTNPEVVDHYLACFEKLAANWGELVRFARSLTAEEPWKKPARLF